MVFFFASAAASSAYLTVSEVFPLEMRAMAIAIFYAVGTGAGGFVAPLLFGILALPIFIFIKEVPEPAGKATSSNSLLATLATVRELGKYPGLKRFLTARFFYTDAQNTVISIMAIFAVQAVGFTQSQANYVLVALATTAVSMRDVGAWDVRLGLSPL